jgi:hypothetical protein
MVNEMDVSQERKWFYEERAKKAIANLQKRNIDAQYVPSREEALSAIMAMIPSGAVVARGDSISFDQIGVVPELLKRNQNSVIDPFQWNADGSYVFEARERWQMYREAFFADIFLTGANAVTLDGKLVNTDGLGNRVAAMIFGPKKVIIAAGINKVVTDVDEALKRIHEVAAPLNAKRHYLKNHHPELGDLPCVRTGSCVDCRHDWRICCYTVIIEGTTVEEKGRLNVVLIGEELGI